MGNRSKFSFPLPGRHRHSRETKSRGPTESPAVSSSSGLSKAQRILGTEGDLNIDSPTWDDLSTRSSDAQSWRVPTRTSSAMSISISESTQSTTYESEVGLNSDKWEQESGVFPRVRGNKASSTLLGQHYNDGATDSSGGRLRHEDSSSTLKSYYDRQKSPLAISQQTSESSARDLALRKGCPPVSSFQRSPLLQVDNADRFEQQFAGSNALSQDKSRKKPAKLDLSMLFAKSRRNAKDDMASSSSVLTTESGNHSRRKLTKAPSKESLRSHRQSVRSNPTGQFNQSNTNIEEMKGHRRSNSDQKRRETKGTLYQLYDHYEHLPTRSSRMSQIPETRVADPEIPPRMYRQHPDPMPTPPKSSTSRSTLDSQSTPARESFSWKNVRASMASPQQWEGQASSAASISSRNSKTSRHTSASQFSHSDLRQHSVLSLSSDSDSEQELIETARQELSLPQKNPSGDHNALKAPDRQRIQQSSNPIETMAFPQPPRPESRTKIHNSRKSAQATSPFLAIPEVAPTNPRISQQRSLKDTAPRSAIIKDKKPPKRTASVTSTTSQQPTPPLSPNSMAGDLQTQPQRSSRFMAVTKQEEALLEALRQKRANMRDKIINEHERMKTPPETSRSDRSRNRFSEASSTGTVHASSSNNKKEEILLYLDTPIANMKPIYSAEPSPDLSDFLTFGASDEDSTPRKSRVQSTRDPPRPDSSVSPILDRGASSFSSMMPPTVRLSAVGSNTGLREARTKKRTSSGVRFADDNVQQEFPLEDNDNGSGAVWGLSGHI